MLILTRNPGESIKIGDDIDVRLLSVEGSKARIGIGAPDDFYIWREEIYDNIQEERGS